MDQPDIQQPVTTYSQLADMLHRHESKSQSRYEDLKNEISEGKREGHKMSDGINTDKVIVNAGSGGGEGMGGMAALVAALGNRNEGSDNAALIAALGNRNGGNSDLAPLMAMMANGGMNNGGMNNIWPIILLALLGRGNGRGGIFGGDEGGCGGGDAINQLTLNQVLAKLGTLEGQIPLVGSQTNNAILEQTNALTALANQNAIATLQGFAGTKDSVQNLGTALASAICGVNQNISAQGCQTREAVGNGTDRVLSALQTRWTAEDMATITALRGEVTELRNDGSRRRDHEELRLQVTNNNTAVAAQSQGQAQAQQQQQLALLQSLVPTVNALIGDIQAVKQGQVIFNSGTMAASGTQAAANTKVA